jgi:hypothetical protein
MPQPKTVALPLHVLRALAEIAKHERTIELYKANNPQRGPEPRPKKAAPAPALVADTEQELNELTQAFKAAIGNHARGNRRLGRKRLYAALIQDFYRLKKLGINLPRNKSLSRKATMYGLAETLFSHGITQESESLITSKSSAGVALRKRIAMANDRVFRRVADAVEGKIRLHKNPPQRS